MSYITIDANIVLDACQEYLNARTSKIHAKQEALIQKKMKTVMFGDKREKAIQSLENGDIFSEYHRQPMIGAVWAEKVEQMKSLATLAIRNKVQVNIDAEMANLLEKYFK